MESQKAQSRSLLHRIWLAQVDYNQAIREREQPDNFEYWMKQYLLGIVSEVDEVLQEINWKIHRRGRVVDKHNLARELADITKYLFSLWEWAGFGPGEMLNFVWDKTAELEIQYRHDFEYQIPPDSLVVITDLDGTVGDYRGAFFDWLSQNTPFNLPTDRATTLAMDVDLGMPYDVYLEMKEEFEATGGYRKLAVYDDMVSTLKDLSSQGVQVLAYTARPHVRFSRIWSDTWQWLEKVGIQSYIQELHIGGEERIARACQLTLAGHQVVLFEDDPALALRAAASGVPVILRNQPYNQGVSHSNVYRVDGFTANAVNVIFRLGRAESVT
jgi:uncharacterized HAD superfamily protein/NTP pyrophosphatase (non-canonical NTP hydrolase)